MNVPSLYNVVGIRLEQTLLQIEGGNDVKVESSMFVRYGLITYGLEWFKQRPILGYGANNFRVMSDQTYEFLGMNFYAHNNYIELLVGVGIIGLLIYYWGYIVIISKSIRIWNFYTKLALTLIIISLFIDIANVSYYSILSQFVLCIAFILIRLPIEHEKS